MSAAFEVSSRSPARRVPVRLAFVVAAFLPWLPSCGRKSSSDRVVWPNANIVLISIDTLRADHLGCYGYSRSTSPNLDEFAANAFVFERAYAQSHNTLVSHATMLTSLNPISHGALPDQPLSDRITTLAEVLHSRGYRTGAVTTHPPWLNRKMGFSQGFDHFVTREPRAERVNRLALEWLRTQTDRTPERKTQPIFLFLHYYDVHSDWRELPYETKTDFDNRFVGEYRGEFRGCRKGRCASEFLRHAATAGDPTLLSKDELGWVKALYDGGIAYTDHHVGAFLRELRKLGLYDSSWIVVTSDHGEEFMEHGRMLHSQPYEETARVPLLIKAPHGGTHATTDTLVGVVDITPTVLAGVGIDPLPAFEGQSLLPLVARGSFQEVPLFWAALGGASRERPAKTVAVRRGTHTLVARGSFTERELYDDVADPAQETDVADRYPDLSRRLMEVARALHDQQIDRRLTRGTSSVRPSEEDLERLRSLGYVVSWMPRRQHQGRRLPCNTFGDASLFGADGAPDGVPFPVCETLRVPQEGLRHEG